MQALIEEAARILGFDGESTCFGDLSPFMVGGVALLGLLAAISLGFSLARRRR